MSRASSRLDDRGAAVVEFSMVAVLLMTLFLAVLQVGLYLHERNVAAASAQAAARYAANANIDSAAGADRAKVLIATALSAKFAAGVTCTSTEEAANGVVLVVVHCRGDIPTFVSAVGNLLPIDVTGRAIKEGR